jgi:hypothetical protein
MSIEIEVFGLPELTARFNKIAEWMNKGIESTMQEAVKIVYDQLPPDPPPSGRSMLPFIKTELQRRWLMWAINSGAITVPYPRTGELRGSLRQEVRSVGGQWVGSIGSDSPKAIYVIDEKRQAAYHRGTWWTLQAEFRKVKNSMLVVFSRALAKVVHGR